MIDARPTRRQMWLALAVVCASNIALLWFFHNRYWYPTDDGFYAHIADRLLSGEVLNRDVQDIHPGYIHFVHAFAFRLFGLDLVSLRYPMVAAALVQAIVVFALLRRHGLLLAVAGAFATNALGIVQFMSPNAHWYCLPLAVVLALWLMAMPHGATRLVGAGVILGTLALFRHLTGIWVAMAVIVLALLERSSDGRGRQLVLMRAQIAIMLAAVIGYLFWSPDTDAGGVILMGIWPIGVLGWMLVKGRTKNRDVAAVVGQLLAGTLIPTIPFVLYHVMNGSVSVLIHDLVVVAGAESRLDIFGQGWFTVLPLAAFYQAVTSFDPARIVNGIYWTVLPVISLVNGVLVIRALRKGADARTLALPMIAVFYAMVAMFYAGPLYLSYVVGLCLIGVMWLAGTAQRFRNLSAGVAVALSVVAVIFHAGQTRERTALQILRGDRVTRFGELTDCGVHRCSLKVSASDVAAYGGIGNIIRQETAPDDFILAIPNDAELYFLTARRNPTRFYNASQGLTTPALQHEVARALERHPPRLVIFRRDDKYNTPETAALMDTIRSRYAFLGEKHGTEIYRR